MSGFRRAAVHFALAAMLLRAFLPAGWMPAQGAASGTFLTICTMDGPVQQADQHRPGKQTPDDGQRGHDECPFAAAPHVAAPASVAGLALPSYLGRISSAPNVAVSEAQSSVYLPQSPRAPPLSA